jgi:CRISPR/Cas system CMR-associated protein Cmr5 small subunit
MKNLDQIRAKNAISVSIGQGADGGDAVAKKVPAMIRENGLLGALAFAIEKEKGYRDVFVAVIAHLKEIKRLPGTGETLETFLKDLCAVDASTLRSLTAEVMAYLGYLRRFN